MGRYVCAYPIVYAIWVITRQNLVLIGSGNSPDAGNKPSDLPAQTDRLSGEVVGQADEVAHGLPSASWTLWAISWVATPCNSTAAATATVRPLTTPMVRPMPQFVCAAMDLMKDHRSR